MARISKSKPIDLAQRMNLTIGLIERLACPDGKDQAFLRDNVVAALSVRVTSKGAKSFVFETKLHKKTIRSTIGSVQAWSIDQARVEARRLRVQVDHNDDPREIVRQQRDVKEQARTARERAEKYTLAALLTDYCDQLERMGRESHKKARGIFNLHVVVAKPALARKTACEVTPEDVTDLMRKLIESGKERTAGKLRSYTRAAFEMARSVGTNSQIPVHFKNYGVKHNPAAETKSIDRETDKDPVTGKELRLYWRAIKKMPTFHGAVLRLHLLTGSQRFEQLSRLKSVHVTSDSVTLMDGKGRPGKLPREHPIPLIPSAVLALSDIATFASARLKNEGQPTQGSGEFIISVDGGQSHVTANAIAKWAKVAGEGIKGFRAKRIRSGVETALARLKVTKDTRGHLLSHGVAGVQQGSYDGHDYMDVKREALELLHNFLEDPEDDLAVGEVAAV